MENNRKEFQRMWEAHPMGVLAGELIANNFSDDNPVKKKAGVLERNAVFFYKKGVGTQFYNNTAEMKEASIFGRKKFIDNKKVQDYLRRSNQALSKGDKSYAQFLKTNLQSKTLKELFSYFEKQVEIFNEIYSFFHACQPQYFSQIEKEIQGYLAEKFSEDQASKVYSILTAPDQFNLLRVEELEWLEIVKKAKRFFKKSGKITLDDIRRNKNFEKRIKNHSDRYIYLGAVEADTPWNIDYYIKLLNKQIKDDVVSEISKIRKSQIELRRNQKKLIKELKIDANIVKLCRNLAKIGYNRLALRFGWTKISYLYIKTVSEFVRRELYSFLNSQTIWDYFIAELKEAIFRGRAVSKEEIKDRQKSFLFYVNNGKAEFYSGKKALQKKSQLISEEKYKVKEFQGQTACRGKVRGRVVLFSWIEEDLSKKMEKMKKGDILVAGQTRPFLMPSIKKAAGIITDEGGITCHAAIVSRELKIPCIIGTRIATRALNDGDLVEVDADKGIVKKIEE